MLKEVLLISALTLAPIKVMEEPVEEPPVVEVVEDDEEKTFKEKFEEFFDNLDGKDKKEIATYILTEMGFDANTVATLVSIGGLVATVLVVVVEYLKKRKSAQLTAKDLKDQVIAELRTTVGEEVANTVNDMFIQTQAMVNDTKQLNATIIKAIALMQDGSAEAKLASLQVMEEYGKLNAEVNDTVAKSKEAIALNKQKEIENKEQKLKDLEEMKSATDDGTSI